MQPSLTGGHKKVQSGVTMAFCSSTQMIMFVACQKGGTRQPNETKPLFCCERARSRRRGGEAAGAGVDSAAVQGRHTPDFLFGSTERNKITEVLLRWAGISERLHGGLAGAAARVAAEVQAPALAQVGRRGLFQVMLIAHLTIFGLSNRGRDWRLGRLSGPWRGKSDP